MCLNLDDAPFLRIRRRGNIFCAPLSKFSSFSAKVQYHVTGLLVGCFEQAINLVLN